MADASSMQNILSLIQAFTGKGASRTTSGGTQTTQTQLSQEAMNGMIKSALESNSGLAAVSGMQQQQGMYNSTTNGMLTNDLLSRITANVAEKGAPTTVTKTPSVVQENTPGLGVGGAAAMAGLSLFKSPIDKFIKGLTDGSDTSTGGGDIMSSIGETLTNSFTDTSSLAGIAEASLGANQGFESFLNEGISAAADTVSSTAGDSGGFLSDVGDWFKNLFS